MTQAQLLKLGFQKIFIDEDDTNHFYYECQFGEILLFYLCEVMIKQKKMVAGIFNYSMSYTIRFLCVHTRKSKCVIELFTRNKIS